MVLKIKKMKIMKSVFVFSFVLIVGMLSYSCKSANDKKNVRGDESAKIRLRRYMDKPYPGKIFIKKRDDDIVLQTSIFLYLQPFSFSHYDLSCWSGILLMRK